MKSVYTAAELAEQIASLRNLFNEVYLQDPATGHLLDAKTMQPTGETRSLHHVDATGHSSAITPVKSGVGFELGSAITVEGRPAILVVHNDLMATDDRQRREVNAFFRAINQLSEELRHDYVTGTFNHRYVEESYLPYARDKADEGKNVSMVLVRVNEFDAISANESPAAVDACLNAAAGVLMPVAGTEPSESILARLEGGRFVIISIGAKAADVVEKVQQAAASESCVFGLSLSRRGKFSLTAVGADSCETGNCDVALALAEQRMVRV